MCVLFLPLRPLKCVSVYVASFSTASYILRMLFGQKLILFVSCICSLFYSVFLFFAEVLLLLLLLSSVRLLFGYFLFSSRFTHEWLEFIRIFSGVVDGVFGVSVASHKKDFALVCSMAATFQHLAFIFLHCSLFNSKQLSWFISEIYIIFQRYRFSFFLLACSLIGLPPKCGVNHVAFDDGSSVFAVRSALSMRYVVWIVKY